MKFGRMTGFFLAAEVLFIYGLMVNLPVWGFGWPVAGGIWMIFEK